MNTIFRREQTVWLEIAGERCEILELLASGCQDQVYRVSVNGQIGALKWYHPSRATKDRRDSIQRLIEKGAPSDRFLWPLDLAVCPGAPSFGYRMAEREPRFRGLGELMRCEIDPTFRTVATAAIELADGFEALHTLGLCYGDVSFGSIFLDPETGEISLGDSDRIVMEGEGIDVASGLSRFLAPEVIRGEARPGIGADLHSLAVILFHLLMGNHPFEGKLEKETGCLDFAGMKKLYGTDPVFIFDPRDASNRPVRGLHDNAVIFWNLYPAYVRDLFTRAFTGGLRDPKARVSEGEWRSVMARLRDQIFYCPKCASENFLSFSGDQAGANVIQPPAQPCWSCGERLGQPMRLRLDTHDVALNQDTVLYPHHLDANRLNDYSEVLAEMVPHPKRPDVWGLKNMSSQPWTSHPAVGDPVEVATGRSVSLVPGLRIRFGNVEGMVQ